MIMIVKKVLRFKVFTGFRSFRVFNGSPNLKLTPYNFKLGEKTQTQFSHTSRMHYVTRTHAPICVSMRGVTRRYNKTVNVEKTVHRARCQRRWAGPLAHGAVANHPSPRNWDLHREVERSGDTEGTGITGGPSPSSQPWGWSHSQRRS